MTLTDLAPLARRRFGDRFGARIIVRVSVFCAGAVGSVLRLPSDAPVEVIADVTGASEADVIAQLEELLTPALRPGSTALDSALAEIRQEGRNVHRAAQAQRATAATVKFFGHLAQTFGTMPPARKATR